MEVSKLPAADVQSARTATAAATEQGPQSPASIAPMVDRADIRPLDVSAALQILLAEVRAATLELVRSGKILMVRGVETT